MLSPTDPFWTEFRALYPAVKRGVYLNNASIQPLPLPVAQALHAFVRDSTEGDPEDARPLDAPRKFRRSLARWLGCSPADLALCASASDGIIKAVHSVRWRRGDEIVLPRGEFPALGVPLRMVEAEGAKVVPAGEAGRPVTEEDLLSAVTPRTRAAAFSWISFWSGYRMDMASLAAALKKRGVEYILVDGVQGVGLWPPALGEAEVDFFVFKGAKWVAGPEGIGALYIRPSLLPGLRDSALSWFSLPCCEDFGLLDAPRLEAFDSARRFDGGSPSWIALAGAQAYLDMLEKPGPGGVEARMEFLLDELGDLLAGVGAPTLLPMEGPHRSSLVVLDVVDGAALRECLSREGVVTSLRVGRVRVSPHLYNDRSDFERLVAAIREGP